MPTPYKPLKIAGNSTGLIQERQEFILPDDGYPTLQNAFIFREQIRRKQGVHFLGRLTRRFTSVSIGNSAASPWTFNILSFATGGGIAGNITNITQANPGQVTSPNHNLTSGQKIIISNVQGMTQVNGLTVTITFVDANNFTIGLDTTGFGAYTGGGNWILANQPNASLALGSTIITIGSGGGAIVFTDQGNGTLTSPTPGNNGTINYFTGSVTLNTTAIAGTASTASFNYYPSLPVMGERLRELATIVAEATIAFDTVYAYTFASTGWQEWIPGTIWTGTDSDFFWTTNFYQVNSNRLFWATNFSGPSGDPIRYTDGTTWTNFAPIIDSSTGMKLQQCLALLAYRGYFVAFNTYEGTTLSGANPYPQRIRWSVNINNDIALTPIDQTNGWNTAATTANGCGFLDLPTAESIISVGFVRDNLIIYCDRSTWQLRFRNVSIGTTNIPFQPEKINTEFGASATFSTIPFDLALVGIGNRGIVTCDGFKSELIDIKIPDLVYKFDNDNDGPARIYGIRNFENRLTFWTYSDITGSEYDTVYPNRRLVYNYENDSWAIFEDSITCFGYFQPPTGQTWLNVKLPWNKCNFPWTQNRADVLDIIGGNQQGYTFLMDDQTTNDKTLFIQNITGNTTLPTVIQSPNHNLVTGQCISITGIPAGTPFAKNLNNPISEAITGATQANPCQITSTAHGLTTGQQVEIQFVGGMTQLNGYIYIITVVDANNFTLQFLNGTNVNSTTYSAYTSGGTWSLNQVNAFFVVVGDNSGNNRTNMFQLWKFNPDTNDFTTPELDAPASYIGGGEIAIRDNFSVVSKKFNFLDQGQNIQIGYVDVLMDATEEGAISLNAYVNYSENPVNTSPINLNPVSNKPDPFFNATVPTTQDTNRDGSLINQTGTKFWHRVYCPVRGNFITLEWTLSLAQLAGFEQEQDVQIDAQVLWQRPAGRMTSY